MIISINKNELSGFIATVIIFYLSLIRGIPTLDSSYIRMLITIYVVISLLFEFRRIPITYYLITMVFFLSLFISAFDQNNREWMNENILTYTGLTNVFVMPFLFVKQRDSEKFLRNITLISYPLSIIYTIALIVSAFSGATYDYITLGSTLLPFWGIILQKAFLQANLFDKVLAIVEGSVICLFASRGCGVTVVFMVVFCFLIYSDRKHKWVAGICAVILLLNIPLLMEFIEMIYKLFLNQGIDIRFLRTILYRNDTSAYVLTSGRDRIWELAIEKIQENPWFGYGIYGDREQLSSYYYGIFSHNMELQIWMHFGVVIGSIIIFLLIAISIDIIRKKSYWSILYIAFFVSTAVFLQFSSEYFAHVYFWSGVSIYCAAKRGDKHGKSECGYTNIPR